MPGRAARIDELLVDAPQQERAQRDVGHPIGHQQAYEDQGDDGKQDPQTERHDQAAVPVDFA